MFNRVVPIPIPVSEIAPILPKMLASVSATTGVQAPIRYHLIYSISNLITGYWGCDRDTSRTGGRRGGRGGGVRDRNTARTDDRRPWP